MPENILLVEDDDEHAKMAKVVIAAGGHFCFHVEGMVGALGCLRLDYPSFDGPYKELYRESCGHEYGEYEEETKPCRAPHWRVLLDLHFPLGFDRHNRGYEPNGLELLVRLMQVPVPPSIVIVTDIHHHHSTWIKRVANLYNIPVVDEKGSKPNVWNHALDLLLG